MKIGNGLKITFKGRLTLTGNSVLIPSNFTRVCKSDFINLIFTETIDSLFVFDEDTGIFEFKRRGFLQITGTINIDTSAQPTKINISTFRDSGAGFVALNGRSAEITVLTGEQITLIGNIDISKGDKIYFEVENPDNAANFKTIALSNGSIVPAAIIDFLLFTR